MRIVFRRVKEKASEKGGRSHLDGKELARCFASPKSICIALIQSIESNNCQILSDFVGMSIIIGVLF